MQNCILHFYISEKKKKNNRELLGRTKVFPGCLSYNADMRYKLNTANCVSFEKVLGTMSGPMLFMAEGKPKTKLISSLLNGCLVLNSHPELLSRNHIPYNVPVKSYQTYSQKCTQTPLQNFSSSVFLLWTSVHLYCLVIICAFGSVAMCVIYWSYFWLIHQHSIMFYMSMYRT